MRRLPPYLFKRLEDTLATLRARGVDIISFGVGDPDLPPPKAYLENLRREAGDPSNHNYSFSKGEAALREAVAEWYKKRFGVDLNPETEVAVLIGSKEGLANIARAFINDGDKVLVPDPAYPVYRDGATVLSDGIPVPIPLLEDEEFRPRLEEISRTDAKMIYLNYPNNPTAAVVDEQFLERLVGIAFERNLIICYDNAYSEISFDGYKAPSILQVKDAKEIAVEFHSCSKTFSITGDRIGFAVGNEKLISGLVEVKSQIDSGPPPFTQRAAATALRNYWSKEYRVPLERNLETYAERRDILVKGLNELGLPCTKPKATFYVWARCPGGSMEFAAKLLKAGVLATPGAGFGEHGEGYLRFALTIDKERIREALERISTTL
ncbi:aminotransferase class I/II-fold pyridoxal phosphate-dependent enzyme [Candidatus Bathyarchaeota archaeon]|nr:aminotransferase class I/II-fold pyridoxal phosphate-dependent enzyme [Candidatus Bathyarchaeota archaeon]